MFKPYHFSHIVQLLGGMLHGTTPADRQMDSYFRANRNMGARDRRYVAETVYGCLRQRRLLEYVLNSETAPAAALIAAYLVAVEHWSLAELARVGYVAEKPAWAADALAARVAALAHETLPLEVRANLPDWLATRLVAQLGETETLALAEALSKPATLDLRANTLKRTRDEVAQDLAQEGYTAEPTPYSPLGLRRQDRAPLFTTRAFRDGHFEVQDEGSQLLSYLVSPRAGERVVDFCAGAGGKTLHLGALMENQGTLYAFDISPKRLENIKQRLRRAGLHNVRVQHISHENDAAVKRLRGGIDRVLVDAPCSGTGTLRRNPDIKWRPIDLDTITRTQAAILDAAARLVKPGGRLVYATCSILREENEAIVEAFLAAHPEFHALPAADVLNNAGIDVPGVEHYLRLYPHRHGTDGFFGAVLERNLD